MQPNFTAGTWRFSKMLGAVCAGEGLGAVNVAGVTTWGDAATKPQSEAEHVANGHLIAAAPDMFRALNSLAVNLRALGFGGDDEISGADTVDAVAEAFAEIVAALAKAGGRS